MNRSAVEGVLRSPVLLDTLATQIIDNCDSISSVSFGLWQSGFVGVIGLLPNGEVDFFQCPEDYDYNTEMIVEIVVSRPDFNR